MPSITRRYLWYNMNQENTFSCHEYHVFMGMNREMTKLTIILTRNANWNILSISFLAYPIKVRISKVLICTTNCKHHKNPLDGILNTYFIEYFTFYLENDSKYRQKWMWDSAEAYNRVAADINN